MTDKTTLIILNHTKFGENSLVIHTISKEYGRRGFMVRAGKKSSMALFLPLNIVEAEVVENPKSNLWSAKNFSCETPLNGIRSNIHKNTISLFMSEVLYRVVHEDMNEDGLFDWCVKSIMTLDSLESDFSNYHIRFLLELAGALGFSPSVEDMAPFADEYLSLLSDFITKPFGETMLIPLNGETRNALCERIIRYLEFHTESTINIRSLAVLRDLYR